MADEEMSKLTVESTNDTGAGDADNDDFVDPWNVVSKSATGVDYDKLISKFKNYFFY